MKINDGGECNEYFFNAKPCREDRQLNSKRATFYPVLSVRVMRIKILKILKNKIYFITPDS
jgi:hypothetical protein